MQNAGDRAPEPVQRGGGGGYKASGGVTQRNVVLIAVAAVIVSVGIVFYFLIPNLVSKDDFTKNINLMNDTVTKAKADLTQTVTGVQNIVNALPTSIIGQVNTAITQATTGINAQITSMQSQVNNMASTVKSASDKADQSATAISNLSAKVDAYKTQQATDEATITALTTRITALEAKVVTPTPTPTSAITAKIKSTSSILMPSNSTTLVGSFRVTLTNTTASDVSDIILDITTQTDSVNMSYHTTSLSGGSTSWQRQGSDPTYADFINGTWGLTVAANSTITLYLTLTITETPTGTPPVYAIDYMSAFGSSGVSYTVYVAVQ